MSLPKAKTTSNNAKAAVFNLFNIGSALFNAMTLCQLIKAIDDFNGKFGIGGVGDVFFLLYLQCRMIKMVAE
jgi:hypothetical protein